METFVSLLLRSQSRKNHFVRFWSGTLELF
jgi:hypothetical protein